MLSFDARSSEEVLILDPSQEGVHQDNQPHLRRSDNAEDGRSLIISVCTTHHSNNQSVSQLAKTLISRLSERREAIRVQLAENSSQSRASRVQLQE